MVALLLRISDQARRPPPEFGDGGEGLPGFDDDATQVVSMR